MNTTIYASTSGEGPDVLLLHGLFGQGSNLRGIARALEAEFRVHCLDLPDHGRSLWLDEASLAHYARAIVLWMSESGIASAHVVGHSLGGKVAMQLALSHASLVNRLVVADIAPAAYAGQPSEVFDALLQPPLFFLFLLLCFFERLLCSCNQPLQKCYARCEVQLQVILLLVAPNC